MDRKEKMGIKRNLKQFFEFGKDRFSDNEINILAYLAKHIGEFDGETKNVKYTKDDFDHDGKYTRYNDDTYRIQNENGRITVEEKGSYHDDDGTEKSWSRIISDAKEIVRIFEKYFMHK